MNLLVQKIRELWPEFIGGGIAYWTHHLFHRVWSGNYVKPAYRAAVRAVRRRTAA